MLVYLSDLLLSAHLQGPANAPPLVFAHALGTNQLIWDGVLTQLPNYRTLTYDHRGHGGSDVPAAPYSMGALVRDAERLMDHVGMKEAAFISVSMGGMVAQGLAVKRLDLVRGVVLSNTASKIGSATMWAERTAQIRAEGLDAYADSALHRQLGPRWRESPHAATLRDLIARTNPEGWAGCASAIAGTDFYTTTANLRLPALAIVGSNDGTTPPDLVRETAKLIPGYRFHLMQGVGHLPMVEQPETFAALLKTFLAEISHI